VTGTYAIGANGIGYLINELYPNDPNAVIYGAVAQGVFTGSSTESQQDYNVFNDLFVAIPAGNVPTNASFTSSYQTGLIDFAGGGSAAMKNALFQLSANGQGGFSSISVKGQAANQSAVGTQTITGATYNFNSDGSATLVIPLPGSVSSTNALFTGSKTIFESSDGNFILGWTAGGYDIFFGIKALTASATTSMTSGLYFTAAVEDGLGGLGADSYAGSTSNSGDSNGDGVVHQRLNVPGQAATDFGTDDQIILNADGSTGTDLNGYTYLFGDGASAFVAIGTGGFYSLQVGLHAPAFSGSGVYLNPIGVVNGASWQPITASIAPGELFVLYGTGLSTVTMATSGGVAFPASLGGVSVTINGVSCPIYYVSSTQIAALAPFALNASQTGLANIQLTNNGVKSNVVQMYTTDAAPGVYSQGSDGVGYALALHAANNQEVTPSNPAQPGEFISLYMTGLGTVTPAIGTGTVAPMSPQSSADVFTSGNLAVYFNDYGPGGFIGNPANIQFAGLAPTLAALYQVNVEVPSIGLKNGDNVYVEFVTDAADVNEIQIPYGTPASSSSAAGPVRASRPHIRSSRASRRARGVPSTNSGS
jgi:uncharacterized protein (TIGR03437 family)